MASRLSRSLPGPLHTLHCPELWEQRGLGERQEAGPRGQGPMPAPAGPPHLPPGPELTDCCGMKLTHSFIQSINQSAIQTHLVCTFRVSGTLGPGDRAGNKAENPQKDPAESVHCVLFLLLLLSVPQIPPACKTQTGFSPTKQLSKQFQRLHPQAPDSPWR